MPQGWLWLKEFLLQFPKTELKCFSLLLVIFNLSLSDIYTNSQSNFLILANLIFLFHTEQLQDFLVCSWVMNESLRLTLQTGWLLQLSIFCNNGRYCRIRSLWLAMLFICSSYQLFISAERWTLNTYVEQQSLPTTWLFWYEMHQIWRIGAWYFGLSCFLDPFSVDVPRLSV